jgi:hypothetical protein
MQSTVITMVCDFASRAMGHVGSPSRLPSFPSPDVPCQDSLANLDAFFAEPTPQLLHKLQGPCPGLSLTPSRRTPSRAMSSCSTASETNCKRVTHRSLSCRVATLLVRLPPLHIPRHHSTTPHQVVIWLPRLRFELHIPLKGNSRRSVCLGFFYLHCVAWTVFYAVVWKS